MPLVAFLRLVKITTMSFDPAAAAFRPSKSARAVLRLFRAIFLHDASAGQLDDLGWERLGNTSVTATSSSLSVETRKALSTLMFAATPPSLMAVARGSRGLGSTASLPPPEALNPHLPGPFSLHGAPVDSRKPSLLRRPVIPFMGSCPDRSDASVPCLPI